MTSPTPQNEPSADERVPIQRLLWWAIIAVILVAGVVLYFRYADVVTPLLEAGRTP